MKRRNIAVLAVLVTAFVVALTASTSSAVVGTSFNLYAGQNTLVGSGTVSNDATNLYINWTLNSGWCMTGSHVDAAWNPTQFVLKNGNPPPGQFRYKASYNPCAQSPTSPIAIPLASVLGGPNDGTPVIAVHLDVWDKASLTTTTVVSRPGVALQGGGAAVASTEPGVGVSYPNCPAGDDDQVSSLWDDNAKLPGNVTPSWGTADWIWNAPYPVFPLNVTGERVGFNDGFTLPAGLQVGGSLMITTDNAYKAVLNGGAVGQAQIGPGFLSTLLETVGPGGPQTGMWGVASQGWQSVETYALSGLQAGANTLAITAANEYLNNNGLFSGPDFYFGTWDPSGPPVNADSDGNDRCINPAGLIYKLTADTYTRGETAWGDTAPKTNNFPGANWATYIPYTIVLVP